MKPETLEWVEKAEGDRKVARREMRSRQPVWDVVCFLAQQCAEKYLKAFMEERKQAFRKTHDLTVLLSSCTDDFPELDAIRGELARLSTYGIAARYPGVRADRKASRSALATAEKVRKAVRNRMGLGGRGAKRR